MSICCVDLPWSGYQVLTPGFHRDGICWFTGAVLSYGHVVLQY